MNSRRIVPFILCLFPVLVGCISAMTLEVGMVPVSSAQVRSVTVTNTNDSGPGSLRQAIADAAPGATIQFDLTYPATITLTSGELWIQYKDVTIAGPGPDQLAISGNHASRIFRLEALISPKIRVAVSGLTIRDGYVQRDGGGLLVGPGIEGLTLTNVAFRGNSSERDGGGMAHYGLNALEAVLTNVTFYDNSAARRGGGLVTEEDTKLTNVAFYGNLGRDGGGLAAFLCGTELTNVIFSGNSASDTGGGFRSRWVVVTMTNVTFSGNLAGNYGGGICFDDHDQPPIVQNSVLWGNRAGSAGDQIYNVPYSDAMPTIAYSDVEGSGGSGAGWDAELGSDLGGNLDDAPLFLIPVDPETAPTTTGDLRLRWDSPAVDAGDNSLLPAEVTTDLLGKPRIVNGIVDMGAFENQQPAEEIPPVVPEASTLLLLAGGTAGLLAYVGVQLRARRRAGTRDK
jgi:predicted outer membrane repeat protein